ncbi:MAG: hypothetical protein IKP58_04745 [Victivallales bacterium]|nr:hypothetical protein [Victivallales bacterium]
MSAGYAIDKLFFLLVICLVAIAPFIAIWRFPATLLTKSLATVVALLFFTMALMGIMQVVAKNYADWAFFPSLHQIGQKLSDEKVDPADVSAIIREWRASGEGYHTLLDALKNMLPSKPTESAKPSEQTEPSEQQPAAAPAAE